MGQLLDLVKNQLELVLLGRYLLLLLLVIGLEVTLLVLQPRDGIRLR